MQEVYAFACIISFWRCHTLNTGVFLTVDSVRFGYREADARNGWNALPEPHRLVNYDDEVATKTLGSREKWLAPEASVVDKSKIYGGEEGEFGKLKNEMYGLVAQFSVALYYVLLVHRTYSLRCLGSKYRATL